MSPAIVSRRGSSASASASTTSNSVIVADRLHRAGPVHQRAAGEQRARELLADEAGTAGDHDAHAGLLRYAAAADLGLAPTGATALERPWTQNSGPAHVAHCALLLGCIADDFTGATDLASMLVRHGMATVQLIGVPARGIDPATPRRSWSRSSRARSPPAEAIAAVARGARVAARPGRRADPVQILLDLRFDRRGNIGPVSEALLEALGADFTIACPALPENGRSVYLGHLFVGEQLLSDSHMRHHPLTPMTDSNLVRVLQRQSQAPVGLVPHAVVDQRPGRDPRAVRASCAGRRPAGDRRCGQRTPSDRPRRRVPPISR